MQPSTVWFCVLTFVFAGQTLANWIRTTWKDLNDPATLYCSEACSGVETWERSGVTVAECGTTGGNGLTCERHLDQSSLSVPEVNYTTRGFYRTRCDGQVICFQNLQPNPHNSSVEVTAGDLLFLGLFTFQPVTLTFSRTGGGGSVVQMCTVDGRSLQCYLEYEDRVSVFGNSIVLRAVVSADSGVYTVREINDGAALIRTVSVTVKGEAEMNAHREASREERQLITVILTGSKNGAVQPCNAILAALTVVASFLVVCMAFMLARVCRNNQP